MKALSIQQPWAWLIVNGYKDVENRTWTHSHRGRTLIHAGLKIDREASSALLNGIHPATGGEIDPEIVRAYVNAARNEEVRTGGIVGEADFRTCFDETSVLAASPWFVGPIGYEVRDARPLPFRALKGALSFFRVEPDPVQP